MDYSDRIDKQSKAYALSFLIENMLRVSMHNIMVKKIGPFYFNESIFPEYEYANSVGQGKATKINVVNSAKQVRGAEREYNISLRYDYPHFWYLDLSVLISLIDRFWDNYFHEMLKNQNKKTKNDIILRLRNILPVRNAIAHHRYLTSIDIGDLESLLAVLRASLRTDYLDNLSEIALNSFETLVNDFLASCDKIRKMIAGGVYIDGPKLSSMRSSFSAVVSAAGSKKGISEFEQAFALIRKYNRLPRKPGSGDEIESFKKNTDIDHKIAKLIKTVEDYR